MDKCKVVVYIGTYDRLFNTIILDYSEDRIELEEGETVMVIQREGFGVIEQALKLYNKAVIKSKESLPSEGLEDKVD